MCCSINIIFYKIISVGLFSARDLENHLKMIHRKNFCLRLLLGNKFSVIYFQGAKMI